MSNDPRFRIDSTKLQDYMTCPRLFFYRHWIGWQSPRQLDLIFGQAWHAAMASYLIIGSKPDYTDLDKAMQAFNEIYDQYYGPMDEEPNAPKNKGNALRALIQYANQWAADDFIVRHVEASGVCYVAQNCPIYFRIDAIAEDDIGAFVLEHKTSAHSPTTQWQMDWQLKTQIGVYANALLCMYDRDVAVVRINGAFISNPPKLRKDGQQYANARDTQFLRLDVMKSAEEMEIWQQTTLSWYSRLRWELSTIAEQEQRYLESPNLPVFAMNTENCTKYRGCPYHIYCRLRRNPLRFAADNGCPSEFEQRLWDPLEEYETAREKLELEQETKDAIIG